MTDFPGSGLSSLAIPSGWEPDAGRALATIHQRARDRSRMRQAGTWLALSAVAASLILMAFPAVRARTGFLWGGLAQPQAGLTTGPGPEGAVAPVFDESNMLRYPSDYRNWVYVGTSLGLSYAEAADLPTAGDADSDRPEFFQNVYIDPRSFASYQATGEFPEGTMMVLEVASQDRKNEPGLQGRYEKEILGIEASVKDSSRFGGGWAYFSFTDRSGQRRDLASAFPDESCWTCHDDHAETDHVFTQFYPVLSVILF